MGNNTSKAWIADRWAWTIASEHVMRAALVGSFAMGHGTANSNLVSNASKVFEMFTEVNAIEFGFDRGDVTSIFDRG